MLPIAITSYVFFQTFNIYSYNSTKVRCYVLRLFILQCFHTVDLTSEKKLQPEENNAVVTFYKGSHNNWLESCYNYYKISKLSQK